MANTNPPKKAQAWSVRVALEDYATPGVFKSSPTIATGDWKFDKDGGGLNNLGTIPAVDPSGTKLVLISLSTTEMNADIVTIIGSDQTSPPEWADIVLCIQTTT